MSAVCKSCHAPIVWAVTERMRRMPGYADAESAMFCNTCPVRQGCWEELQQRVREERPEAAARWDVIVERNRAQGIDNGRVAASLMAAGRPDPWMRDMLANIRRGQEAAEGLAA